ncbi:glycoside hydrolase family 16 protein [Rhodotorula graminis WP1]|uniref:Glycoside hydrolase family 16 protein n=1 Tax=Rhodotorula graminis (strain WP1) TaxID=578459 RepID=A0A194SBJ0_RHOGW|nr:glycoside hydrolase family 16 protein [Rhodotorula graminis WP1]KPV77949.1 glycoside hydrolase family 16 protein [Rhodotorula graminis WP1]
MARSARADSSSSDDSRLLSSDASDSDDDDAAAPRPARSTTTHLSPIVWVSIAVLVVVVAVLLAVVVWQQTREAASEGGADAAAAAATTGAQSAAATTRGGQGGEGAASPSRSSSRGDEDDSSPTRSPSASSPAATDDDARRSKTSSAAPTFSTSTSSSGSLPALYGEQLLIDFSTFSSTDTVTGFLEAAGLAISDWPVGFEPISVMMTPDNVDIVDGALSLKVTGQSGTGEVQSAEVATVEQGILYGKVTTRAKASPVPGVCHGFFFYDKDNREVDIELLTSYYTKGRGDSVKPGIQYTNHPLTADGEMYNEVYPYPWDPTAAFHDYTVEWTASETIFSLDDQVIATFTVNVPKKPMTFNWNSWSSGEPNWSAGPPTEDSFLLISAIAANWTT